MTPEQKQAIADLRALSLAPKQIARQLGLKTAEVQAVIKQQAEQVTQLRTTTGDLDPLVECWVDARTARRFLVSDITNNSSSLVASNTGNSEEESLTGIAIVTVTRESGYNRFTVSTYLVDTCCLGVKDAMNPRKVSQAEYKRFIEAAYENFSESPVKITLEQAQGIVFSAVEYAAALGFNPHPDFEEARHHLGQWNGSNKIECGRNGKPFYISGPYDDPMKIIQTLRSSVGEGNFDVLVMA